MHAKLDIQAFCRPRKFAFIEKLIFYVCKKYQKNQEKIDMH